MAGEFIASGSDDGRWFIWSKGTGRLIKMLNGDENGLTYGTLCCHCNSVVRTEWQCLYMSCFPVACFGIILETLFLLSIRSSPAQISSVGLGFLVHCLFSTWAMLHPSDVHVTGSFG